MGPITRALAFNRSGFVPEAYLALQSASLAPLAGLQRSCPLLPPFGGLMVVRLYLARWRFFLSVLVFFALAIATLVRHGWQWSPNFLIAWDLSVVLYLSLVFWLAAHADLDFIRRLSKLQDVGRLAIPGTAVVAALASLIAVL